ncbi:MAG: hypothetical protein ACFFEV_03040, partial [Candidatus Thorarchaeota archaeon]
MVRVPYEDNIFVGTSVILLVVMGFIVPISVVSIFGFSPQVVRSTPPPSQYSTLGTGTPFDSLIDETIDPVAFVSDAPVVVDDTISITTPYPSNINVDEIGAICIATNFISLFEYLENSTILFEAFLSNRIPCWVVNSQVEGGSVCIWINAVSGIVCLYSLNVDLHQVEDTDLRLYFSGSTNISIEEAETCAFDFLQQNNYSMISGSIYKDPWYKPLPPGNNSEGFVNGEYYFQIYGMHDGIFEFSNKVHLQVEASTGAVVYFNYLWTEHPGLPSVNILSHVVVENSAVAYLLDHGFDPPI